MKAMSITLFVLVLTQVAVAAPRYGEIRTVGQTSQITDVPGPFAIENAGPYQAGENPSNELLHLAGGEKKKVLFQITTFSGKHIPLANGNRILSCKKYGSLESITTKRDDKKELLENECRLYFDDDYQKPVGFDIRDSRVIMPKMAFVKYVGKSGIFGWGSNYKFEVYGPTYNGVRQSYGELVCGARVGSNIADFNSVLGRCFNVNTFPKDSGSVPLDTLEPGV